HRSWGVLLLQRPIASRKRASTLRAYNESRILSPAIRGEAGPASLGRRALSLEARISVLLRVLLRFEGSLMQRGGSHVRASDARHALSAGSRFSLGQGILP